MYHERFDCDLWATRCWDDLSRPDYFGTPGSWLAPRLFSDSPVSAVIAERFRQDVMRSGQDLGIRVPVDRFLFSTRVSPHRFVTKVNGLPYRPANRDWPVDRNGNALSFLVQFCFADSRDIIGPLPGDVLVVFVRTKRDPSDLPTLSDIIGFQPRLVIDPSDPDSIVTEWYHLGLNRLVTKEEMADTSNVFPTCIGIRHRSIDYVEDSLSMKAFRQVVPERFLPLNAFAREGVFRALARNTGTKIGGVPLWRMRPENGPDGRFIATFSGVNFAAECPYPWPDRREPLTLAESTASDNYLDFRDGGGIHFFMKRDGTIDWYLDPA